MNSREYVMSLNLETATHDAIEAILGARERFRQWIETIRDVHAVIFSQAIGECVDMLGIQERSKTPGMGRQRAEEDVELRKTRTGCRIRIVYLSYPLPDKAVYGIAEGLSN